MARTTTLRLALSIVVLAACGNKDEPKQRANPSRARPDKTSPPTTVPAKTPPTRTDTQVEIGSGDRRELGFTITAVHENRRPAKTAPWHSDGGKWTYIDAKTKSATFTLGFMSQPLQGVPFERATAMLIIRDKASVTAFTAELATALHAEPPSKIQHVGKPLKMNGVVLGRDKKRTAAGYGGRGGGWITCKWTIEGKNASGKHDNAEVYFNVNLAEKRGVFAEKDADYNAFLISSLASRL